MSSASTVVFQTSEECLTATTNITCIEAANDELDEETCPVVEEHEKKFQAQMQEHRKEVARKNRIAKFDKKTKATKRTKVAESLNTEKRILLSKEVQRKARVYKIVSAARTMKSTPLNLKWNLDV